jgi:hypothetical protein
LIAPWKGGMYEGDVIEVWGRSHVVVAVDPVDEMHQMVCLRDLGTSQAPNSHGAESGEGPAREGLGGVFDERD